MKAWKCLTGIDPECSHKPGKEYGLALLVEISVRPKRVHAENSHDKFDSDIIMSY